MVGGTAGNDKQRNRNYCKVRETKFHISTGFHENSKQQKPNPKQIPMTQIQNSKQMIRLQLWRMAPPPADRGLRSDMNQLW
jgi:hypothetical protein